MERANFFVVKKVDNRTTVDTKTFHPLLSQYGVTTVTLINFTQNSNLNKCLGNFNLKPK